MKNCTILDVIRQTCNKHVGEIVTRAEMLKNLHVMYEAEHYSSTLDNIRRQLTVCDYLGYTGIPGKYVVLRPIEQSLTTHHLKKLTKACYSSHKDSYINNSKTLTDNFTK